MKHLYHLKDYQGPKPWRLKGYRVHPSKRTKAFVRYMMGREIKPKYKWTKRSKEEMEELEEEASQSRFTLNDYERRIRVDGGRPWLKPRFEKEEQE